MKIDHLSLFLYICVVAQFMISCSGPTYDKNGVLFFENLKSESQKSPMLLEGEKYTGPIVKYYSDGVLEFKGSYKEGVKHGAWKYYHPNGKLKRTESAQPSQGDYEVFTYRNRSGILYTELTGNGEDTIHYKKYHHNGRVGQELIQKDGKRIFQKWTSFGNLYHYYNSDSIVIVMNIKTREITHKGRFENGQKTGHWFKYYADGVKKYDQTYRSGKLVGKSLEYFQNGYVDREANYNDDGELDGLYKKYHQNGQLFLTGRYNNGKRTGTWTSYSVRGKVWNVKNYKEGKLNGHFEDYNSRGYIREKGQYLNDRKVGVWNYYDKFGKFLRTVDEGQKPSSRNNS